MEYRIYALQYLTHLDFGIISQLCRNNIAVGPASHGLGGTQQRNPITKAQDELADVEAPRVEPLNPCWSFSINAMTARLIGPRGGS